MEQHVVRLILANHERRIVTRTAVSVMHDRAPWQRFPEGALGAQPM